MGQQLTDTVRTRLAKANVAFSGVSPPGSVVDR